MRRSLGPDLGLTFRMGVTIFLLAALYLLFIAVLYASGVDYLTITLIAGGLLLVQYFFSDRLVLSATRSRLVSEAEAPELHALVERLAAGFGINKPKVAVTPGRIPNAFATGRNPKNAVVAVTEGLMEILDSRELEGVLAHELTHIKNRDVAVITFASFFATVASFIVQNAYLISYTSRRDERGGAAFLLVYLASLLVWVISFFLIQALSRYREYAADRGAAIITGAPSMLASALLKISGQMQRIPNQDLRAVGEMNAFFIIPASKREAIAELFSTHPSLQNRLRQLQELEQALEGAR